MAAVAEIPALTIVPTATLARLRLDRPLPLALIVPGIWFVGLVATSTPVKQLKLVKLFDALSNATLVERRRRPGSRWLARLP